MKTMQRYLAAAAFAGIAAGGAGPALAQSGEKIAVFTKNQTNPFFQVVRLGANDAARQMGASVTHYVPTKPDSIPEQLSQIAEGDRLFHRSWVRAVQVLDDL